MAGSREDAKRAAARQACERIQDGMTLGLGTGSTAYHVVERVGELIREGMTLRGVPTSEATRRQAEGLGIPILALDEVDGLDLCLDGTDEIDPAGHLIKGGGGALTREKLVALAARAMIVVADDSKKVERLGRAFRLPIEILPFGGRHTLRRLEAFGAPQLRLGDADEPYVTDNGNHICDLDLGEGVEPTAVPELDRALKALAGVVECGLFPAMAAEAYLGCADGTVEVIDFAR